MNLHSPQMGTAQAYQELIKILRKPYQDVCVACDGRGKLTPHQDCPQCKGSGNRWLRLI
jgi:DnaJ-class molecular chaperone